MLTRRRFLGLAGGVTAGAVGGAVAWSQLVDERVRDRVERGGSAEPGRVLLVVQCLGGNDGLNTLVPADGRYRDARPALAVPEGELVALEGEARYALHPSLEPLAARWASGELACVEALGIEGQTRSHFEAMDTWWAADTAAGTSGWLGRWLDATSGDEPDPLRAVALGDGAPILAAERSISTTVRRPDAFTLRTPPGVDADGVVAAFEATAAPLSDDPLRAAAQLAVPSTLEAVAALARANGPGEDPVPQELGQGRRYGDQATRLLETAAGIVELDIGTQVLSVGIRGFDTHANQLETHASLLADVAGGIDSFLTTMEERGHADRVLVITTSEFGRRVSENASGGTDHGTGGVHFLAGRGLNGQIVGDADLAALQAGDVRAAIDSRSLFAVALDWLGGPTDEILGGAYDRYDLLV